MSLCPLSLPNSLAVPDAFLVTTDTEIALLSLTYSSPVDEDSTGEEPADVMNLGEDMEEEAEEWMLQGVRSEYMRCSWEQYGVCCQQVFVCRTCRDQYDRLLARQHPEWSTADINSMLDVGALCEQCAYHCHEARGHEVVELGMKKNVACDCGNMLFRRLDQLILLDQPSLSQEDIPHLHECSLCPSKPEYTSNHFNHNWRDRWCYCDKEERLPMVQCVSCCDWFHEDCAKERYLLTHGEMVDLEDEKNDFYCEACEAIKGEQAVSMKSQQAELASPVMQPSQGMLASPVMQPSQVPQSIQLQMKQQQEKNEDIIDEDEEKKLERRIRARLKKNDKAGAMKLVGTKRSYH